MTSDLQPTARQAASRRNGARSRGPRTAAGKIRSSKNALRHGFAARKLVLLDDENPAEFRAFARALQAELMPEGRLQTDLVGRIVMAAWRARRADKLEAGVLATYLDAAGPAAPDPRAALGAELILDNHGARALATLVRYRGSVLAECAPLRVDLRGRCWEPGARSLAALKALQAQAGARVGAGIPPAVRPSPSLLHPNEPRKLC